MGLLQKAERVGRKADRELGLPPVVPDQVIPNQVAQGPLSLTSNSRVTGVGTYDPSLITGTNPWEITPAQTTQGQLDAILAKNSPIQQHANTAVLQGYNTRGLLNTGQALGNAQLAVIQSALPIATQDADVNSRSQYYNADTINKAAVQNQAANNQASQFGAGSKLTQSESELGRKQQTALQNSQQTFQSGENQADRALQVKQDAFRANVDAALADINNAAQGDRNQQQIYGNMSQEVIRQVAAINTDVNMDQQSKDYAINQLMQNYKAQVSLISAVGAVPDVSQLLDFGTPAPVAAPPVYTSTDINTWLAQHAGASDAQIAAAMRQYNISPAQMAAATGLTEAAIVSRMQAAGY